MATQLKHTDIRPIPVSANEAFRGLAPRPNVRVAFIAGEATAAIHDAMAKLSQETRDGTLEDLVWDKGVASPSAVSPALQALIDAAARTKAAHLRHYDEQMKPAEERFYAMDRDTDEQRTAATIASGLDLAEARLNDMLDLDTVAQNGVATFRVTNAADLAAKIAFMTDRDMLAGQDWRSELRVDAAQIAQAHAAPSVVGASTDDLRPLFAAMIADADTKEAAYLTDQRINLNPTTERYDAAKGTADEATAKSEYDAAHARHDDLVVSCCNAQYAVCEHPVTTAADLRAKLAFMKRHLMGDGMDWTDTLLEDAERIAAGAQPSMLRSLAHNRDAVGDDADKAILDAFAERRREFAANYYRTDMTTDEEDAYFKRIDASEAVISQTSASTIAGVVAKLRIDFVHRVGRAWSDHAIMDPSAAVFVEGLKDEADDLARQAWAAIEDLARIAGVNLSEQGA